MKGKVQFTLKLYLIFLFFGIFSCSDCGSEPNKFIVKNLEFGIFKAENSSTNYGLNLTSIVNNSVKYNQFSIQINTETELFYGQNNTSAFNLIRTAYACDIPPPTSDEKIRAIEITTNKDFNSQFKAGNSLNDLFDVIVLSYTDNYYYERFNLNTFLTKKSSVTNSIILILKEAPDKNKKFQFDIRYSIEGTSKKTFSHTTPLIEITL